MDEDNTGDEAVSYTHLDVYKRQEWVRAVNNVRNAAEEIVLKELIYR